ncbi:MAG: pentapeptide repeat-containing protein [Phototrophicaceae bacterium]
MANPEHLAILQDALAKDDIEIWNQWRKSNPDILVNLMNADLRGADLRELNLKGASLNGALLSLASLTDANLNGVDLSRALLIDADLKGVDLSRALLIDADLSGAELVDANLNHAQLIRTFLHNADLTGASLTRVDLTGANLTGVNLTNAYLNNSSLDSTSLYGANLTQANLSNTRLINTNLTNACLREASLFRADLIDVSLDASDLYGADLRNASLSGTDLANADLNNVECWMTIFANIDLSNVKNLDTIHHIGPSTVGIDTLYKSGGNIPEIFLRGCGVPDNMIDYAKSLVDKPIDYYSVFISYSTANEDFAKLLYDTLQGASIRCWYAPEQLLPGQRIDEGIHRGIQYWDKVLFCASKSSLTEKWWVDFEVDKAFKKSRDLQRERGEQVGILIPLNLDNYMFNDEYKNHPRASQFETTLAADFVGWKNDMDKFNREVKRIIKALQTDGGLEEPPPSKL